MHRLFIALRPPPLLRRQLLAIMGGVVGARWQTDDQLHLTLQFVGGVDGTVAEDIAAALMSIDRPRPTVALAGVGLFERRGHAHSLWAGVAADPALAALHERICRALRSARVPLERRAFKPHITLARLGRGAGSIEAFLAREAGLSSEPATFDAFILYRSHLGSEGASYEAVARYPLH